MYAVEINGTLLELETDPELFSPNAPDRGTLAMLAETEISPSDRVLDLGCGCGIVGIYAAKLCGAENVVMCDISEKAVSAAQKNAERNGVGGVKICLSDGFGGFSESGFGLILSNPPYHADFSVPKRFIEEGYRRLALGGRMVMVTKRLEWYKNKLTSVFGGCRVRERDGYFVFIAEKRGSPPKKQKNKGGLSKKLAKKRQRL